jgi:hypothetical protein
VHVIPKDQAAVGDVEFLDDGPQDFSLAGICSQPSSVLGQKLVQQKPAIVHLVFFFFVHGKGLSLARHPEVRNIGDTKD